MTLASWSSGSPAQTSLVDVLDKVLDKGLVVAGDIQISLANVELLTIKVRLLVCSVDKAQEIGLDWWRTDGFLSSSAARKEQELRERIEALEKQLPGESQQESPPSDQPPNRRSARSSRRRSGQQDDTPRR